MCGSIRRSGVDPSCGRISFALLLVRGPRKGQIVPQTYQGKRQGQFRDFARSFQKGNGIGIRSRGSLKAKQHLQPMRDTWRVESPESTGAPLIWMTLG